MRVIPILCQIQAYKGAGGATKKQFLQNLAYNQEKIYFSMIADFFFAKSLLLVSFLGKKAQFWQNHIIAQGYTNQLKIP